jgi:hypothetical protein
MARFSLLNHTVVHEMLKISGSVHLLVDESRYGEIGEVLKQLCLELIIQRRDFSAKEVNIFSESFSFKDFSQVTDIIQTKIQSVLDLNYTFQNQSMDDLTLKSLIINLVQEEQLGTLCWLLSSIAMEIIVNRKEKGLNEFTMPDCLVPNAYKQEAYDLLVKRFVMASNQPQADTDELPF